jgi:probable lipoprotein NlpC
LDCSGLVYLSFRDALALGVPRTAESLYAWAERIPPEEVQAGDLLFFKTTYAGTITHVGIYAGDGRFIHSASSGPQTGVMFSYMSEDYWRRNYMGARRALPVMEGLPLSDPLNPGTPGGGWALSEAKAPGGDRALGGEGARSGDRVSSESSVQNSDRALNESSVQNGDRALNEGKAPGVPNGNFGGSPISAGSASSLRFSLGLGASSSWGMVPEQASPIRGAALQFRFALDFDAGKLRIRPGIELRPEWDGSLGVFRLPLTFSLGINDVVRVFAGPALSLGEPVLLGPGWERRYTGGNSWLGVAGITAAPFSFKAGNGTLAPYGELVWQSFFPDQGFDGDLGKDLGAALKFSTGLRYTWDL